MGLLDRERYTAGLYCRQGSYLIAGVDLSDCDQSNLKCYEQIFMTCF